GVVHVADYHQDPGKKMWTWGTARSGKIWDNILSDNDGAYNEIQSGRFYTQGYREFMNPRRVEHWTEYWYPVRALDSGYVEATSQMAINATYIKGVDGQPQIKLMISPVADVKDATVVVKQGQKILNTFAHVHFVPLEPVAYTVTAESLQNAKSELNVQILSSKDEVLLQWSAADPVDGNQDLVAAAGKTVDTKLVVTARTPVEELYLHGVFVQKTGNLQGALKNYDQVLQRDPSYVPALLKEAWVSYESADFKKADSLIERAQVRGKEDPSITYAAGVIYRAEGRWSLAKDAFWTSIHYGSTLPAGSALAPSFVELGEIAIRQGNYSEAIALLNRAIGYNPDDAFALTDLAAAERLSGNMHDASEHAAEAVRKMPLLPYALAEQAQTSHDADWTQIIRSDRENYLAIASWYHDIGAWQSSDVVLHTAIDKLPTQDVSPMMYYYLASNAREEGKPQVAEENMKHAASMSMAEVFPNRITDATLLADAIHQNPADAHAKYALGNFLFAHARYDEAADLWSKALQDGFNDPILLRNLGLYQWRVKNNPAAAAGFYQRALQLNPADYRLYTDLDEIYEQQGNTTARAKLFASAPADILDQDTVRARHALFLIEQSKPDEALSLLVKHQFKPWEGGVVIRGMFVVATIEKGKKALANHQPEQAAADFRKAMEYPENMGTGQPNQPDTAEQLYWLGNALAAQQKTTEANAAWTQAAEQGKNNHSASAVFSALAYKKLGKNAQAREILDRCIQSAAGPDATAIDYYSAGMANLYSGNKAGAQRDFQRALAMDPLLWQARTALETGSQSPEKAA
ncbi:MAG: DUF5107 domain-containing protein, partial [Ktedonobacteraceae bacterium]|nr:DUF5107 domain-containing protein [Ktedonobacteraceae bacterium]